MKPETKPWWYRKLLYYKEALSILGLISNWQLVVKGYLHLADFRKRPEIILANGLRFIVGHYLDVWGIKEVIGDNDYRLTPDAKIKTVLDIGANIGTFSVLAAITFPQAKIYCFEPSASTYALLKHNLKVNGVNSQVDATQVAVFSEVKKLKLYNAGPSGIRSLFQLKEIDFLKVDCEGAEYEIFRSLTRPNWKKIKRLALEFHELIPGQDHRELLSILKKNGFKTEAGYHPIENTIGYIYAWK